MFLISLRSFLIWLKFWSPDLVLYVSLHAISVYFLLNLSRLILNGAFSMSSRIFPKSFPCLSLESAVWFFASSNSYYFFSSFAFLCNFFILLISLSYSVSLTSRSGTPARSMTLAQISWGTNIQLKYWFLYYWRNSSNLACSWCPKISCTNSYAAS